MTTPSVVSARLRLGAMLTRLAEAADCRRSQLQKALDCGPTKVHKLMTGQSGVSEKDLNTLLKLLNASPDDRKIAKALAKESQRRRPKKPGGMILNAAVYPLEESATTIRVYATELVPGLLQRTEFDLLHTASYAQALFEATGEHGPEQVEKLVSARRERSARLIKPDGPHFHAILGEGVIHWKLGGPHVMKAQLEYLVELQELPHVTIQVMPFTQSAHPVLGQAFTILEQPEDSPDRVYSENTAGGSQIVSERTRVERCQRRFARAAQLALTPDESSALIATIAGRL